MNQQIQLVTDSSGVVSLDDLILDTIYENGDIYEIDNATLEIWNEDVLIGTALLETGANYPNSTILYNKFPVPSRFWAVNNMSLTRPLDGVVDSLFGIYISEETDNLINHYTDLEGGGHETYGSAGSGIGEFDSPTGVALDSQGRLYVADKDNDRIVRIDNIDGDNWIEFSVTKPIDVHIDSSDRILYVQSSLSKIARIDDMLGTDLIEYGTIGSGEGNFNLPLSIITDTNGDIYVSDGLNKRVVKISDMLGNNWEEYKPTGSEELGLTTDIHINSFSQLYITDNPNSSVIRIDDMDGTNRTEVLSSGAGDFEVKTPSRSDMNNDILYLADNGNLRFITFGDQLSPHSNVAPYGLSYTWTSAEITTLSESLKANYKAVWNLNEGDKLINRWFDVVYWKLYNPTTMEDILNEKPELVTHERPELSGRATSNGTVNTLVCDRITEHTGFYDGALVKFNSGDNNNSEIIVDTWDNETSTLTFHKSLTYATNNNDRFVLSRSFKPEIDAAWLELFHTIQGWRPNATDETGLNKVVDSFDLKLLHLYKSIINICSNRRLNQNDTWDLSIKDYSEKYTAALNAAKVKIDEDNDGVFEETDQIRSMRAWMVH